MCPVTKVQHVAWAFVLVSDTFKQCSEPIKTQSNCISLTHSVRPCASHGALRTDDDDTKHRKPVRTSFKFQLVLFSILVLQVFQANPIA